MNSFELNKILGAVLGTLLFIMAVGFLAEAVYAPIEGKGPGYNLPEPEVADASAGGADAEPTTPLAVLLASASADRGATAVRKCQSCHNFGQGEPNKQGPYLYDIVDAPQAHADGFAYSDVLSQHKADGLVWSYENLDAFLASPKGYAPGTKMAFAGVKSPEERADILAYLQTLSASPVAFPAAEEGAAATEEAPAAEEAPAVEGTATPAEVVEPAAEEAPVVETAPVETPTTTSTDTPVEGTPAPQAPATSN